MMLQATQAFRQLHAAHSCKQLQLLWGFQRREGEHGSFLHTIPTEQQVAAVGSEQQQEHRQQEPDHQKQQQQQQQQQCTSEQQRAALGSTLLCAQGQVLQQFAASSLGRPVTPGTFSAALQRTPPTAAATAAAAAAAAAAGGSRGYFQVQNERPGHYWSRQLSLDGRSVTVGLVAANVGAYGMQMISPQFTRTCMRVGSAIADGEYWRLLTAAFLHGNILHCGINMLALYNVGPAVEASLGGRRFLGLYLGSALGGNVAGYLLGSGFSSSMGSSGALYGIFAGYLVSRWLNRKVVPISGAEVMSVGATVAINFALMTAFSGAIDQWAHLGGFLTGAALTALIAPRYGRRW